MSGITRLVPDLFDEIMFRLPLDIGQKFAFAQVSRYWRTVALDNHLFWSSFTSEASKADCYRVPTVLQRSGTSMLHVNFQFSHGNTHWFTDALGALVPYAARIQSLDMELYFDPSRSVSPETVKFLLNSDLEFPSLQTLRLRGPEYDYFSPLLLTAPQLRTLDLYGGFEPANWETLLSPSLENITVSKVVNTNVETLFDIFTRCPRAWRVVFHSSDLFSSAYTDADFEAFALRRPLAPPLRELDLELCDSDLGPVMRAGFADVVLPTLTGCIYNTNIKLLSGALLPGLGPLVFFEIFDPLQIELRDEDGRIRRLWGSNEDASFEDHSTWEYLSAHYNLHKTVREIRIGDQWDTYAESFNRYPPQLQDGISFVFKPYGEVFYSTDDEKDCQYITKMMCIPGLAKVEFAGDRSRNLSLKIVLTVLAHIEPPTARKVELCVRSRKLFAQDEKQDALGALQTALSGSCWTMCSQCMGLYVH